jgi:hypothetical protein
MGLPASNCTVPEDKNMNDAFCPIYCIDRDAVGAYIYKHVHWYTDEKVKKKDLLEFLISFVCSNKATGWQGVGTKLFVGDHLESASPADPSFWVIHPTLERLLQAKYMGGGFVHNTWASKPAEEFVCMRPDCYNATQNLWSNWSDCCLGHFPTDRIIDPEYNNRSILVGDTNEETLAATDASSAAYSMPYIYDSISWDHCEVDMLAQASSHAQGMAAYRKLGGDKLLLEIEAAKSGAAVLSSDLDDVRSLRSETDSIEELNDKKQRWLDILTKTNVGPTKRQQATFARKTRIRLASGKQLDDEIPGFVEHREKVKAQRLLTRKK